MADPHHASPHPAGAPELTYGRPQDYPENASQLRTLDTTPLLGDALRVNDLFSTTPLTAQQYTAPTQEDILPVLQPIFDTTVAARNQLTQLTRSCPALKNAAYNNHQALLGSHAMIDNITQAIGMFTHHHLAGIAEINKSDPRTRVQDLLELEEAANQFTTQLGQQLEVLKAASGRLF